jgi:hypothetical protein
VNRASGKRHPARIIAADGITGWQQKKIIPVHERFSPDFLLSGIFQLFERRMNQAGSCNPVRQVIPDTFPGRKRRTIHYFSGVNHSGMDMRTIVTAQICATMACKVTIPMPHAGKRMQKYPEKIGIHRDLSIGVAAFPGLKGYCLF